MRGRPGFPHALVLHEEELNEEMLLRHGVDRAGAFVTCAGDDRTNLLAATHAKHLGARVCLAVVSRDEYVPLVDALPIDGAFSLRLTTAEAILRLVHSDSVRAMHIMLTGAEVLDLHAEAGAEICGQAISEAGPLEGCEVGAIVRDDQVVIPADGERILAGDACCSSGCTAWPRTSSAPSTDERTPSAPGRGAQLGDRGAGGGRRAAGGRARDDRLPGDGARLR